MSVARAGYSDRGREAEVDRERHKNDYGLVSSGAVTRYPRGQGVFFIHAPCA